MAPMFSPPDLMPRSKKAITLFKEVPVGQVAYFVGTKVTAPVDLVDTLKDILFFSICVPVISYRYASAGTVAYAPPLISARAQGL